MRFSILSGEDLARKEKATVLVPRGREYYIFFRKNYYYAALSDQSSLYTNDLSVVEALRENGVAVKDYFDEIRFVELPTNTAPLTNLRRGRYTVIYRFRVSGDAGSEEDVAKIMIVGNRGFTILKNEMVPYSCLDENGLVEYKLEINLEEDMSGIMFYILGQGNYSIDVLEVSYQMTPSS